MNENLQKLEVKIENQGTTPQGKVPAAEWNILVAAVKALDAAGIDTETLAKYLKQYQYITTPELEELLKDVTENLDGVVDLKSAQTIEGLKDFINGFKIGGALVKYDTAKKCFIFTENVLMEKGLAWNSRFGDFTEEEIFSITKAVDVDWKTIGKNASGQLYVINGGGEGGGGNYDPDFLHYYLTNNNYITESALTPYAKTTDVNSLLTGYLSKSGGTVNGEISVNGSISADSFKSKGFTAASVNEIGLTGGFGIFIADASTIDTPAGGHKLGSVIETLSFDSNAGNQIYYSTYTSGLFYRSRWGGEWRSWRKFLFEDSSVLSPASGTLTVNGNILATGNVSAQSVIINGKTISYNASKNAFVLPANLLVEGGIAWNAKIGGFEVPTITDAVSIDGTSIIRAGGVLRVNPDYIQAVGGLNENELNNYLTNKNYAKKSDIPSLSGYATESFVVSQDYITQPILADTLTPYAKTADVNSLLTDYLPKSSSKYYVVNGDSPRFIAEGVNLNDLVGVNSGFWNSLDNTSYHNAPYNNFGLMSFRLNNAYFGQLMLPYSRGDIMYRSQSFTVAEGVHWLNWRTIIDSNNIGNYALPITGGTVDGNITATKFIGALEGNADTVTKLATSRTLWGQSFDGTSDVDGSMEVSGLVSSHQWVSDTGQIKAICKDTHYVVGVGATSDGLGVIQGGERGTGAIPLLFNPSGGNVAIGGTSADEKLHVYGNAKVDGYVTINGKPISYNAAKNTFVLPANLIVEGGTAKASISADSFKSKGFTAASVNEIGLTGGFGIFIADASTIDTPAGGNKLGSVIETLSFDSNAGNQIYHSTYTSGLFYRSRWGGEWRSWRKFLFEDSSALSPASGTLTVNGNFSATGNVSAQNVIVNGKAISYNASNNAFVLPANLLVEGGIAWNAKIDGFDVPTITAAVSDHERRIKDLETENKVLKAEIEKLKRAS